MRAALYARHSSDLQSDRSVDDQLDLLRTVLASRGWREVAVFVDRALSGAALSNRPGVMALLAAADAGAFEVVFTEALDRLSRDLEGTAHIFKRLTYVGVELVTMSEGQVSELHVGLTGTMNQLFLRELGAKTRRGLLARVRAGGSAGGRCYGYRVEGVGGLRINPDEADIIRRVYRDYAAGSAPKAIAHTLNREGVPAPRGGEWSPSTLYGDRRAQDGILCQELYRGIRIFNRRRGRRHPLTGKRSFVLNPAEEWVREEVAELRIIDDELWSAVDQRRKLHRAAPAARHRQPKRLLSGLIWCGVCGSGVTLQGGRYTCTANRDRGTCRNGKIISALRLEKRVIGELDDGGLSTAEIRSAVCKLISATNVCFASSSVAGPWHSQHDHSVQRKIDRCKTMYVNGIIALDELSRRVDELQRTLTTRHEVSLGVSSGLSACDARRFIVDNLDRVLDARDGDVVRAELRRLITRVELVPEQGRGKYHLLVLRQDGLGAA